MTTKDIDLDCYGANLESSDMAMYEHLFGKPWIPTEEELDDMGFEIAMDIPCSDLIFRLVRDGIEIYYFLEQGFDFCYTDSGNGTYIYPTSRQDIETLIKIFTNPK